jgi:hypothetical protein
MCFENILAVVMLSTVLLTNTYAAGEPVNEDLSLLFMLSDELVDMGAYSSEGCHPVHVKAAT